MTSIPYYITSVPSGPTAVAIGKFDGLHLGHQALLHRLKKQARHNQLAATVLLLEPHPSAYFTKQSQQRLMSIRTKRAALLDIGVQHVALLPFWRIVHLPASVFVNTIILNACHCQILVIGENFRFGYKQAGGSKLLARYPQFHTTIVPNAYTADARTVSSSLIKKLLQQNQLALANQLLGYSFTLSGVVVSGDKRGRMLGFPTANIHTTISLPLNGIYYGFVTKQDATRYPAITNIGTNPTFGAQKKRIEVHLLDTKTDLYGQRISFTPLGFVRNEIRYSTTEALKKAIAEDANQARAKLATINFMQIQTSVSAKC